MMIIGDMEIRLRADIARLQRDMDNARRVVSDATAGISRAAELAKAALASIGLGAGLSQIVAMSDQYAKFTAQLKLATQSTREYAQAYDDVRRIATSAQADLGATGVLYARIANGTRELGISQKEVANITETVNMALKVSGATAAESASAMLQLSQSFASGTLRGEEFNAVNEAAPRLMLALADGMGVPVGALKQMASDGLITSKIMADVLPKALEKLRDESKEVQTISGAFAVLKNNVMEFTAVHANANGSVALLTGGIGLLANNLTLLFGVIQTITVAKFATWASTAAVAVYEVTAANMAMRASTLVAAEAEAASTTAKVASLSATQAMIVVAREDAVAKLSGANASMLSAKAAIEAATAAGAQSFALRTLTLANNELVVAETRRSAMLAELAILGRQQVAVSAQITAATVAQAEAQTVLAAATGAGGIAAGIAARAIGFLGGPIGAVITVLGLAATAWTVWGNSAEDGAKKSTDAVRQSTDEILIGIDKQIEKLKERNAIARLGIPTTKTDNPASIRLGEVVSELDKASKGAGEYASLNMVARQGILASLGSEYGVLTAKIAVFNKETDEAERNRNAKTYGEWMVKYASKSEQLAAELKKAHSELGAAFTPEIEARIRKQYEEKDVGAKKEQTAYTSLITTIGEKIAAGKLEMSGYDQLSESQKLTIKLDEAIKTGKRELTPAHIANAKALIAERAAQETVIAANKQAIADVEARVSLRKAEEDGIKSYFQSQQEGYNAAVKGSSDALKAAQAEFEQFGMSKSQIAELTLGQLELNLAKFNMVDADNAGAIAAQQQIDKQKELIDVLKKTEIKEEYKNIFASIDQTAHDTFVNVFNGGKNAFDKLRDTLKSGLLDLLYQMTIKKWIFNIGASVTGGGISGVANAATGAGIDMLSTGKTLWDGFSGGMASSMGTTIASAGSALGMSAVSAFGTGMTMSTASAAAATGAGAVGAGVGVTGTAGAAMGAGASVAAAIPYVAAALAVAYVLKKGFGHGERETTSQGIEGSFSGGGFSGNNFNNWKEAGGWFTGDNNGRDTSALDATTAKQFSNGYAALQTASVNAAKALGLSADSISSYSEKISLTLTGDKAKDTEAITKLFADVGNNLAAAVAPGIAAFAKDGETASATLSRLASSITTANAWLSMLKQRLFQVSMAGGDAASKLADAFGGLENLTTASKAFYDTYYTEGERTARSTEEMAKALAMVNLSMPTTKDQLRSMAASLDLNTASGRAAYATLLAIAPEFAAVADITAKMAKETADKLIATFTGGGKLAPALDATSLKTLLLKDTLVSTYSAAGNISTLFLNVNSGLITFGARTASLTGGLTGAQLSAGLLSVQIDSLRLDADKTRINIAGLSTALAGVNTETFMTTIGLVFENLATRIQGVIDSISTERVALREAALQIINPTVMSKSAIQGGIAAVNTKLPSNAGVVNSLASLNAVGDQQATLDAAKTTVISKYAPVIDSSLALYNRSRSDSLNSLAAYKGLLGTYAKASNYYTTEENFAAGTKFSAHNYYTSGGQTAQNNATYTAYVNQFNTAQSALAAYAKNSAAYSAQMAVIATQQAALTAKANAASDAAKAAQLAYTDALQNFAIDASKSVSKLGKLREETVKYYEAQKQLADLMTNSAAGLRNTVADYRYSQMSDAQQFNELQTKYSTAYAMGLSTSGETLTGYGDKLSSMLGPLLEKAKEVYGTDSAYNAFAATALARAETIAGRLETLTPTNYAADSLTMLGQIDSTLAALDASSKSAEKLITDAIKAGSDKTAAGLHAVIAALTGQAIPGFASGGHFGGGYRIVGENGPELEATGPSRIFNASQTRAMLSGGGNTARLEALVERLTQEVEGLRIEARATATSSGKTARHLDRIVGEGVTVRNDADTPLTTAAA